MLFLSSFSPSVLLASRWCIHTVVLTQPKLGRNPVLFYQLSNFHTIKNPSVAVNTFLMRMLTLLSVDEILLPRYMNWSTNFRVLPFKVKMTPFCFLNMNCFICIYICNILPENKRYVGVIRKVEKMHGCKLCPMENKCCILTFDPAKLAIPRWCTRRKWHIPMAVMRGNHVGGNWLTKWDKLKFPHRLMHWKRVTCELHDSYFRLMTIKHAIPKIE